MVYEDRHVNILTPNICLSLFDRIKIGTANIVVLNDIESIKAGFTHAALQSRSNNIFFDQTGNPGT